MRPILQGQERLVARLMFGGAAIAFLTLIAGAAVGWLTLGSNAGQRAVLVVWGVGFTVGFLVFVAGLGIGLAKARGYGQETETVVVEGTYIVAVTALNPQQQPVWNEEAYMPEEIARYVHLRFPDGRLTELRIMDDLLPFVGEGMTGVATIEGDRMVRFECTRMP